MTNRNNGTKTVDRNPDGTFGDGNPGRPKGSRHKTTLALEALIDGQAEELTQAAIDKALEGDTTALRLCLERLVPPRKDTPVQFDLPPISNAKEAAEAAQHVLQAVSDGELTPLEAASVMGLLERYRRILELSEIEGRVVALERAMGSSA